MTRAQSGCDNAPGLASPASQSKALIMVYGNKPVIGIYTCIVYCDRSIHERVVEQFTTEIDFSDFRMLQAALAGAIRRDYGTDRDRYSMDVLDSDGYVVLPNYRPTEWLD
jgi:hypothetical protein